MDLEINWPEDLLSGQIQTSKRKLSTIPEEAEDAQSVGPSDFEVASLQEKLNEADSEPPSKKKAKFTEPKITEPPAGYRLAPKPCTKCLQRNRPCWIKNSNVGCYLCKDVSKRGGCSFSLYPRSRVSGSAQVKQEPQEASLPSSKTPTPVDGGPIIAKADSKSKKQPVAKGSTLHISV